jgi:hypothetical protein
LASHLGRLAPFYHSRHLSINAAIDGSAMEPLYQAAATLDIAR